MVIDAHAVPGDQTIQTDVCIIGAGAAGITLARQFVGQPFRVCLLESGGLEFEKGTQSLYAGENTGFPYPPLDVARLRYFGGTTNHWTGWCQPLDEIDFESRDWIPYSGWPFNKNHLDPFYERAQSICELGPFLYDADAWETPSAPRFHFNGDRVITKIIQLSPPTRFGKVYRDEIVRAGNITLNLYANVINIETPPNGRTVTRVRVASLQGNRYWVAAKIFILATGVIENARLLLLSNQVRRAGLGNQYDLVGRFFMEHPWQQSAVLLLSNPYLPIRLYESYTSPRHENPPGSRRRTAIKGALVPTRETQRSFNLVNFRVHLAPIQPKGIASLQFLFDAVRKPSMPDDLSEHLGNVIADIDDVARLGYGRVFKGVTPVRMAELFCGIEQVPDPHSRVTLSTERDVLGQNRVVLHWGLTAAYKHAIRRATELIAEEFGRAGLGRVKIILDEENGPSQPLIGFHHIGTTRMHRDPKKGVVDENCRVHDISNLFIAGSSVFPTSGASNPTLTIVALSLRLADHVKRLMT
ncbi:MAG: GMC family oxidoreductase [Candidatus Rokubacteria bacterium]|nr:GMC family oxidoreductase [Candidatus Rokubacteria bacterium]